MSDPATIALNFATPDAQCEADSLNDDGRVPAVLFNDTSLAGSAPESR